MAGELNVIRKIVDQAIPYDLVEGRVSSVRGLTASFTIIGTSGSQEASVAQGVIIAPGNRCVAVRPPTSQNWIILATFGTRKTGYVGNVAPSESTQLFPPQNMGVITTLPGFLIYRWDAPAQKSVTFEVQISTDAIDNHGITTLTTRGSYYIVSTTVTTYVRVRSVDLDFKSSIWTPWLEGVPTPSIYTIIQDNGDPLTPRSVVNYVEGENVRLLIEDDEDNNATNITINALPTSYILIQEQQVSGTEGGTFTSGSWETRSLNTVVNDDTEDVVLSSNQFTLPAGTYRIFARVPACSVDRHKARLQNITDSTTTLYGSSAISDASINSGTDSIIQGKFTIADPTIFEIQHACETTSPTSGFGFATSLGTEIFTSVQIDKE